VGHIDKRNRLDEAPFSYRVTKNNTVLIDYNGKQVKLLKGKDAEKILERINIAEDEKAVQLILAKITGNFKRGNERNGKSYGTRGQVLCSTFFWKLVTCSTIPPIIPTFFPLTAQVDFVSTARLNLL
jgi:hypothetical protein